MGDICVISVDYLKIIHASATEQIGRLPDGIKPLGYTYLDQSDDDESTAYIAPLRYRGENNIYGQIMVTNTGIIRCYINETGPSCSYFYGQLVFPVTRS